MKCSLIKEFLQEKMNIFYQEMRNYLAQVKNQNRAKTLALRFLVTAQKQDETSAEKEIRNLKKNSVFLFPNLEIMRSGFNKNKEKPSKISSFAGTTKKLNKVEEEVSISSSNSLTDESLNQIKSEELPNESFKKTSTLDEKAIQRPIFKYLPEDNELRTMIRKTLIPKKK